MAKTQRSRNPRFERRRTYLRAGSARGSKPAIDSAIAGAAFEGRHLVPPARAGDGKTKLADVALLCATCHRLVHRRIAARREWLSLEAIKEMLGRL